MDLGIGSYVSLGFSRPSTNVVLQFVLHMRSFEGAIAYLCSILSIRLYLHRNLSHSCCYDCGLLDWSRLFERPRHPLLHLLASCRQIAHIVLRKFRPHFWTIAVMPECKCSGRMSSLDTGSTERASCWSGPDVG